MARRKALVIDSDPARRQTMARMLQEIRFDATEAADGKTALQLIETVGPDLVVCDQRVTGHSSRALCEYVKEFVEGNLPFVLVVPEEEADPERIRREYQADGVLRHPVSRYEMGNIGQHLLAIGRLNQQLSHLQEENRELREALQQKALIDPVTRFYRFDVFKQMIVLEVKRAKRYGYPLSIMLMAFDRFSDVAGWLNPTQRKNLYLVTRRVVTDSIRDIDIPLLFAEEKVLIVMPHTDLSGAAVVADRIREQIGTIKPPTSLAKLKLTVSISVASTERAELRSFGMMIQEAMRGLKEAEIKGGDVVLVCRSEQTSAGAEAEPGECVDTEGKLGPRTFFV